MPEKEREPLWRCANPRCGSWKQVVQPTERGRCPNCGRTVYATWPTDAVRECFADGCEATTSTNEYKWPTATGWAAQADHSRYACPAHVGDLRRLLGLSDSQPVDA